MKKSLIFGALAATVMAGSMPNSAQAQVFCEETGIFIPEGKECTTTTDLEFGIGDTVFNQTLELYAVDVDSTTNEVLYALLEQLRFNIETGELLDPLLPEPDADILNIGTVDAILDPTGAIDTSFRDFGTPSNFSVTFAFPNFVPTLTGPVTFTGDMAGSLTDGTGPRDGVSISPVQGTVVTYTLLDVNGSEVSSLTIGDAASLPAGPPDSHTYGPFDQLLLSDCGTAGCGTVEATISFAGSGFNDRYGFTGRWDVLSRNVPKTPESSGSAALLALGLLGLPLLRRQKNV
jgi:MYXO-CTERM domain-containing protein